MLVVLDSANVNGMRKKEMNSANVGGNSKCKRIRHIELSLKLPNFVFEIN